MASARAVLRALAMVTAAGRCFGVAAAEAAAWRWRLTLPLPMIVIGRTSASEFVLRSWAACSASCGVQLRRRRARTARRDPTAGLGVHPGLASCVGDGLGIARRSRPRRSSSSSARGREVRAHPQQRILGPPLGNLVVGAVAGGVVGVGVGLHAVGVGLDQQRAGSVAGPVDGPVEHREQRDEVVAVDALAGHAVADGLVRPATAPRTGGPAAPRSRTCCSARRT